MCAAQSAQVSSGSDVHLSPCTVQLHGPGSIHVLSSACARMVLLVVLLQETVTVDLYIIRKIGLFLRQFPQVRCKHGCAFS
jgi:hypothetical protein